MGGSVSGRAPYLPFPSADFPLTGTAGREAVGMGTSGRGEASPAKAGMAVDHRGPGVTSFVVVYLTMTAPNTRVRMDSSCW